MATQSPTHRLIPVVASQASLRLLTDAALLLRLTEILRDSRRVEADLVAHIAEVDERRLYLREASSSMFNYCVERLHLSEPETALRIVVARALRRHPARLEFLRDGRLHLSGIALLAPRLDERNCQAVLAPASHLSKRQVEELVAELAPRPDVQTLARKLLVRARPAEAGPPAEAAAAAERAEELERASQHRPDDVAAVVRGRRNVVRRRRSHSRGAVQMRSSRCHPPATRSSSQPASH